MIRTDHDGAVWTLTIDRPDKANALDDAMLCTLLEGVKAAQDAAAHLVILVGRGTVFSAGADLGAVHQGLATSPLWEELSALIAALPCLTIAALNGTVAGGAMGMVLACDLRIAVAQAHFFYPVMGLGVLPQPSDAKRLVTLLGPQRAKMLLLAGQRIDAEEALRWGLVDRICDAKELLATAHMLGSDACAAPHAHLAAVKARIPSTR